MRSGGLLQRLLRHYSPMIRSRGRVLRHFSSKFGLVYLGAVDQHEDEHDVIRGLTVSTTHRDTHYAVGSFDGYDVSIVDRFDVSIDHNKHATEQSWLIMQIALEDTTLPHVFFKPLGHSPAAYTRFFTAFNTLHIVNDVFNDQHTQEFHSRYEVYGLATHAPSIEQRLTPAVTQIIAARFWPHAVEVLNGKLYVYTTEHRLNETVLGSTLEATVWLASILDDKEA